MAVHVKKHLHQNHAFNTREADDKVMILQGDYGIGDPQLDQIQSLIRKVNSEKPIQGNKRMIYLFSSLGTIEYALEMSGYSKAEIAEFFKDRRNRPHCFAEDDTVYLDCETLNLERLEEEIKEVL